MTVREKLEALAANMWWSWNPEAIDLFCRLNPAAFQSAGNNPLAALRSADEAVLEDEGFKRDVDAVYESFEAYMQAPPLLPDCPRVSYFCMEYGIHESLPIYAGGLGILAGDHAKQASDDGIPFTAIGLFLKDGYFVQSFDAEGWQQESYPVLDLEKQPVSLVRGEDGEPVVVTVPLGYEPLAIRAWKIELGRTRLYLLDTDFDRNPAHLRDLTCKLYQGDRKVRIRQEIILGIGGVRLLRALNVETDTYHMNEGHCAFLALELLRERLALGDSREAAEAWVRERGVFTTHTPVMAGHDRFSPELFLDQMAGFREQIGLSEHDLLAYGRVNPWDPGESFTMTVLGLKLARQTNGVSRLNGEVARGQWHQLYPDRSLDEVPIGYVTNGIHLPTWAVPKARAFVRRHLGDLSKMGDDPAFWQGMEKVSDEALWQYRNELRHDLIEFVESYGGRQSLRQTIKLDPDALTIGFARRFATYKRAPLLFYDLERAIRLFSQTGRPIQVIYAGKAHPADEGGKRFIQQIHELSRNAAFEGKLVFLENYTMEIGRRLVSGCDVWLNNPRRPMEASGTSGQKIAVHGGLNVSILDGWWPEGYNGENGWAIGYDASATYKDPHEQDAEDAAFLYDVLENQVIPTFYERDERGIPTGWVSRMRNAMMTLTHEFSAARMVRQYVEQIYGAEMTTPATR